MERESKLVAVFETWMNTIRNSVSFPYNREFAFSVVLGAVILEQVVDLVGCMRQVPLQAPRNLFGYEVAY